MIVIAIMGLLAAVAVPNYVAMIAKARRNVCAANREQIDSAKALWSVEHRKPEAGVPTAGDLRPGLKDQKLPVCPSGGAYTIGAVGVKATCSFHPEEAGP